MDNSRAQRREIDLDIVRGIAILLAMGWHINSGVDATLVNFLLLPGAKIGWAGVDLFFVLSGFLIGGAIIRELKRTATFNYRNFFIRRVFRLWPVLYTFLFAMAMVVSWRDFFWQTAFHVQNFVSTRSATHLWSLAVEEHFYVLLGLGLPILIRWSNWRKSVPVCMIAVLFLCPLLRWLAVMQSATATAIQTQTQFRLDAIAMGVLLSFLSTERPKVFESLLKHRLLWIAIALSGSVFLWVVPKSTILGMTLGYSISWITAAAFLLCIYRSGVERRFSLLMLSIAFIGQVSYPLYLWHVPVMKLSDAVANRIGLSDGVRIVLTYLAAIAVATVITNLVERPVMRWRDRVFPTRVPVVEIDYNTTIRSI